MLINSRSVAIFWGTLLIDFADRSFCCYLAAIAQPTEMFIKETEPQKIPI